jgi:hypothetical protein
MRTTARLLVILTVLGAGLQSVYGQEPSMSKTGPETKIPRPFIMRCYFTGKGMNGLNTALVARDGQKLKFDCADPEQKLFIHGKKTDKVGALVKRELTAGVALEARVTEKGDHEVILDLSLEMSGIAGDATENGQLGWLTKKYSMIECVPLGKKIATNFGDFDFYVTVDKYHEPQSRVTDSASRITTDSTRRQ